MRSHKKFQVSKLIYKATVKKAIFGNFTFLISLGQGKFDLTLNFLKSSSAQISKFLDLKLKN